MTEERKRRLLDRAKEKYFEAKETVENITSIGFALIGVAVLSAMVSNKSGNKEKISKLGELFAKSLEAATEDKKDD